MRRLLNFLVLILTVSCAFRAPGDGVRIKDISVISGARDNQLVGYGLVVGLAGDGDKNPVQTVQTIANVLQRYGFTVPQSTLSAKDVAVVMVTADIPAFKKPGTRLDVTVSAMGDAKTIQGGVLVQTPLFGADNIIYAVAQGAMTLGSVSAGGEGGGASVQKNHPTVGQISGGALVEKLIPANIVRDHHIELLLREPDFTTAARMAAAINVKYTNSSEAVDATSVRVRVPEELESSPVDFVSELELIELEPDVPARIVINERTGTIVATSRIRISSCAVAHGNLTISISTGADVSQPNPLSTGGQTVVTPKTDAKVKEDRGAFVALPDLPTVEKVAAALNSLGVTPRDVMSMFQAMKEAGALQADLLIR
jgi:flagellar P-ring protein precursor FlgI